MNYLIDNPNITEKCANCKKECLMNCLIFRNKLFEVELIHEFNSNNVKEIQNDKRRSNNKSYKDKRTI